MAAADLLALAPDAVDVDDPPPPVVARGRWLALGVGLLVLGAVLVWVGAAAMTSVSALPRGAVILAGFGAAVAGLDRVLLATFRRRVDTLLWLSVAWMVVVVLVAALADVLPLAEARDTAKTISEPALVRPDLFSEHPLGTDRQALDILGGLAYGARVSLIVGVGATVLGLLVGGALGLVAGFLRGRFEAVTNLLTDAMIAFPPLILLLALVAVLEASVRNVTLGLAVLSIPIYIRLARANTLVHAERDFVLAARVLGAPRKRIALRELLPNVLPALASYGFVVMALLIVAEASLSYLGLSIQRPNPTWGNMIAAGQQTFERNPHLVFAPGLILFLTVFALNRIGEAARHAWDAAIRR